MRHSVSASIFGFRVEVSIHTSPELPAVTSVLPSAVKTVAGAPAAPDPAAPIVAGRRARGGKWEGGAGPATGPGGPNGRGAGRGKGEVSGGGGSLKKKK